LVKVGNQPMILWNIKQLQEAGIKNIYIVIGYRGEEIKKELTNHPDISANINYIEQNDNSKEGMLKSVMSIKNYINEQFFLLSADVIIEKNPYSQFADIFSLNSSDLIMALISTDREQFERSGALSRIALEGEKIINVGRDLPYYNGLQTGVYYFGGNSIDMLDGIKQFSRKIKDFDELLNQAAIRGKLKAAVLDKGEWFDVNTPATHVRADIFMRRLSEVSVIPQSRAGMQNPFVFSQFRRERRLETEIIIETGLLDRLDKIRLIPEASAESPHYILTDSIVDGLYGEKVLSGLRTAGYNIRKIVIPAGEETKKIEKYEKLADEIFSYGIDERSIIISLGGGVINNIAGFLASTLYRGIGLIHLPTTMMAQVDAAIDFKQAVNSAKGKNLIGSYYPAMKVAIDPAVILSLEDRHIYNGLAESIKHALTQDDGFFSYLNNNINKIRDLNFLENVVRKTIELKVPLLNGDIKDDFNEMLPQYGHAVGHAIEHLSSYELLHGEAVAVGMCVSAEIAKLLGICSQSVVDIHYNVCESYKLPTIIPDSISAEDIINAIRYDKHYLKRNPYMALIKDIGEAWHDKNTYGLPIDYSVLTKAININKNKISPVLKTGEEGKKMSKNIIVTGGSQGIGKAIARDLLKDGYSVYICARREEELKKAAEELSAFGQVGYFVLNLADKEEVKKFASGWDKDLYALINNAGICKTERLEENFGVWDEVINVNLNGIYYFTKGLAKHLINNGRIINISSQLGKEGRAGYGAYCASKFGVIGLTKCWAKELGNRGITVNAICPGWVETDMALKDLARIAAEKGMSPEEYYRQICQPLELKRFTAPEEIANLAAFLVSEKASGITGRDWLLNTIWNEE